MEISTQNEVVSSKSGDNHGERELITVSGDNVPKEETRINSKSLEHSKILTKRGFYVMGLTSFAPSLIPKIGRGSTI